MDAGEGEIGDLLHDCLRLEAAGWKGQSGTAIVSRPETWRFYARVARAASDAGTLRLGQLRLDGRLIAFELEIEHGGSLYDLKSSYDEELRKYAPGTLVALECLAYAHLRRLRTYEFLGTEYPWKRTWTSALRDRPAVDLFARTPAGVGGYAVARYGRPLARRAVAAVRR